VYAIGVPIYALTNILYSAANDPLHNELAKDTNRLTTPYLYIDGKFIGAESDLDMLLNTGKLYGLLSKANIKFEAPGKDFAIGQQEVKKTETA